MPGTDTPDTCETLVRDTIGYVPSDGRDRFVGNIGLTRKCFSPLPYVLPGALFLAGCSFAPPHARPALPVAPEYAEAPSEAGSIATLGWREFFAAPELRRLIGTALANNRDIRIAAGRVEEARAAWRIDGSWLYPDITADLSGTRARMPGNVPGLGEPVTGTQIHAQLGASWEIDFWGRLRNLREYARQQYLASEEARRGVATSLVANVAITWLAHREYEERIALARESITTRDSALRILRQRHEVGSGSRLDLTQAQLLLAQAKTALHALEQQRDINFNALVLLVGQPVETGPGKLHLAEGGERALPPGLPSELLTNRPDIMAAEHQLRAANADIGAARAAFFPNISLTGTAGTASSELEGLFGAGSGAWSFSPSIRLPIFNAGRLAANLDLAEARRNTAIATYEQTVQRAFRDVSDALVRRRQLQRQIASTEDMLAALTERARLARLKFDHGRAAYLEVLDAERNLFDTQQTLVQLRHGYYGSGVALYAALGGGFPAQPDVENRP